MPRIIILGTGTDVGKTYVTAQLALALRARNSSAVVTAVKPVESGTGRTAHWDDSVNPIKLLPNAIMSGPPACDAEALARASSPPAFIASHAYQFADPISPHLAARNSGCAIDPARIVRWTEACAHGRESQQPPSTARPWLLIETAGATHSPLGPSLINADLALLLGPAIWVLVAPDRLGVLHDVTTTLSALNAAYRLPDLIVLSQPQAHDRSTGTNGPELSQLGIAEVSGIVPTNGAIPAPIVERILEHRTASNPYCP